jgi:hypothetical protein
MAKFERSDFQKTEARIQGYCPVSEFVLSLSVRLETSQAKRFGDRRRTEEKGVNHHTQAGTVQANTSQTGHVRTNDPDQHGVCQLVAFSSGSEQGNQQDLQGVFQRKIPICDPQPNHPGCEVPKETPTSPYIPEDVVFLQQQNFRVEKSGNLYSVSFPTLEKRIGVPVIARSYQQKWLERMMAGTARQGTAKLFRKKRKWFIALPITFDVEVSQG